MKSILQLLQIVIIFSMACKQSAAQPNMDTLLNSHWQIQSSTKVKGEGREVSSLEYATKNWYAAQVPGTILGSLVNDGVYKNIFFDENLKNIPEERFDVPWWYRTVFDVTGGSKNKTVRLRFNGINYRAAIWLNGHQVASSGYVKGGYRRFIFEVSKYIKPGHNVLALKVTRPQTGDPTLGFVDWNPTPPDHDMGIWRSVHLLVTGPVSINQPFVETKVDTTTLKHADLVITAILRNHADRDIHGTLSGLIGDSVRISQEVDLPAEASKKISFTPKAYPQLAVNNPKLWWVYTLGKPNLYNLHLSFSADAGISDEKEVQFGIRSVSDYITQDGFRGFKLNGKKLLIKGGGWVDPMLLNGSPEYERVGIEYALHMNLNTIRMEGFAGGDQHLYRLCNKKGILLMAGVSAGWEHMPYQGGTSPDQFENLKTPEQMAVVAHSLKDQVIWLRNHPSIFVWSYGSDRLPRPALEKRYLNILKKYDSTRPHVAADKERISSITGPTRMKMRGPYDYVPPAYWYVDKKHGGNFGFNSETGPGAQVPVLSSLKKMIPPDSLWPISQSWIYHTAGKEGREYHNLKYFNQAMNKRLGKPKNLKDYERKAQYLNYENTRAMFEAFEANRFKATGIIQWMYNSAWPSLWWQLYDYYLNPTGAFYGARKANEPVHISYNYGHNGIDLINNTRNSQENLTAKIKVLNVNLNSAFEKTISIDNLPGQETLQLLSLPDSLDLSTTYFLDLRLENGQRKFISSNFYVLSTRKDKLDESSTKRHADITPQLQFANLKMLQNLPLVKLQVTKHFIQHHDTTFGKVTLKNNSAKLAFMIYLNLEQKDSGNTALPIFWDDNYITLLPGEQRTIKGYCHTKDLQGQQPEVTVSGWNVK